MAGRHSKRLKHEEPDVVTSEYECFVCHLKSETCERSVQLHCCKQYLHRRCQIQWERYHNTCGLCREPLSRCNDTPPASSQTNWTSDDDDEAAAEAARMEIIQQRSDVDTERIANDVLNMTREEGHPTTSRTHWFARIGKPTRTGKRRWIHNSISFYLLWFRSLYRLKKIFFS